MYKMLFFLLFISVSFSLEAYSSDAMSVAMRVEIFLKPVMRMESWRSFGSESVKRSCYLRCDMYSDLKDVECTNVSR